MLRFKKIFFSLILYCKINFKKRVKDLDFAVHTRYKALKV